MLTMLEIAQISKTTKLQHPCHIPAYIRYFQERRTSIKSVFEMGVGDGESLGMWEEWFPNARVFGLDNFAHHVGALGRVVSDPKTERERRGSPWVDYWTRSRVYLADQDDVEALGAIVEENGEPFDLIVDDAGHDCAKQQTSFRFLFPHVQSWGCYVIEDLESSYWAYRGRGVGVPGTTMELLKKYLDGMNHPWLEPDQRVPEDFLPGLESIHFHPNIAFLWHK